MKILNAHTGIFQYFGQIETGFTNEFLDPNIHSILWAIPRYSRRTLMVLGWLKFSKFELKS